MSRLTLWITIALLIAATSSAAAHGQPPTTENNTPAPQDAPQGSAAGDENRAAGDENRAAGDENRAPGESDESVAETPAKADEVIVTATRHEAARFTLPYATDVRSGDEIRNETQSRTLPEALEESPSVLLQQTSHGQGSPFIRGFTGYQNVLLIDGIRLNNSTFRAGPNQYWGTVDHLNLERLELVLGPGSVLYGSDAIGGAVNAIPRRRQSYEDGFHLGGRANARYATAEDSYMGRLELEGNHGAELGFLGGLSYKSFGDLEAGSGELPNTSYDQYDGDLRIDWRPNDSMQWTFAYQHTTQDDVPRTHRTVFAVPFHGSSVGSELRRDTDQDRDLAYARLTLSEPAGFYDTASFTLSYHRQEEERDRLRTGDRRDLSGFEVETYGAQAQFEKSTDWGYWTFGAEYYHDIVDSFRRNYSGGTLSSVDIQGPVGDDAGYGLLGIYAQDEVLLWGVDWIAGVRFNYAHADADRVDNPAVPGSDPTTPGNIIGIDDSYDAVVGSLRGSTPLVADDSLRLFFGASQGFRTPSLSDLTAFDSTSVIEVPTEDLDPEHFLELEVGLKFDGPGFRGRVGGYYTLIDDLIVRSPTGDVIGGTPVVRKDNVGDGFVAGVEFSGEYDIDIDWSLFGSIAWQDGEVDQFQLPAGGKVTEPISRLMPLSGIAGTRYEPQGRRFWIELFTRFADDQDDLSLRDRSDTERIPPGGTPGWATANIRGGYRLDDRATLGAAIENITDKDYRIHGSGLNQPGLNFILSLDYRF